MRFNFIIQLYYIFFFLKKNYQINFFSGDQGTSAADAGRHELRAGDVRRPAQPVQGKG